MFMEKKKTWDVNFILFFSFSYINKGAFVAQKQRNQHLCKRLDNTV
jgi:hypothetical protein